MAWTVFVSGDSYLSSGFSTRTGILDLASDKLVTTLEDFTIDGRGRPRTPTSGASASPGTTPPSTRPWPRVITCIWSGATLAAETITVLDDGMECPSLSPDDTRLVYKKRLPDLTWQLWVYDLASRQRTQLTEPGDVDDQAVWLDERTVAYAKLDENNGQLNVWSVPADGSGAPTLMAEKAESPIPLR